MLARLIVLATDLNAPTDEGAMTSGFASAETDAALQKNIVAAGYKGIRA